MMRSLLLAIILALPASALVTFDDDIFPRILGPRCVSCHGQFTKRAGLAYHTYAAATANSAHLRALDSIQNNRMPQGSPLTAADKALFAQWIADGAPESAPQNQPPVAVAGASFSIDEGDPGSLDGSSSSDDVGIASFSWSQILGPDAALVDQGDGQASFTAPSVGEAGATLTFRLTVTDGEGLEDSADIVVTVANVNQPPVAVAGNSFSIDEGNSGSLDGSSSSDDVAIASFAWSQILGPDAGLVDQGDGQASFTAPSVGEAGATLTFRLTVTDGAGLGDSDDIVVTVANVNQPPVALALADPAVLSGSSITADGSSSSDSDGSIDSFTWSRVSGPNVTIANSANGVVAISAPAVDRRQSLKLQLLVVDDLGASASDIVTVDIFPNASLVARAGRDREIGANQVAELRGHGALVPLARIEWSQTEGDSVQIENADQLNAEFLAPAADATLIFQLEIEDIFGRTAQDSVLLETKPSLSVPLHRGWNLVSFPFDLSADVRLPGRAFFWTGTQLEPLQPGTLPARRGIWLHAPARMQLDAFGAVNALSPLSSRPDTWELVGPLRPSPPPAGFLFGWCFERGGFRILQPGRMLQPGDACFLYFTTAQTMNLGEAP